MKIKIDVDDSIGAGIAQIARETGVDTSAAAQALLQFALAHMRRRSEDKPTITAPRAILIADKTVRVIDRPGAPPLLVWRDVVRALGTGIERNAPWFVKRYAVPVVNLPADVDLPPAEKSGRPISLVLSLPDLAKFGNELDGGRYFAEVARIRQIVDAVVDSKPTPVRFIAKPTNAAGWYWIDDEDGRAHGPLPSEEMAAKARGLALEAKARKALAEGTATPPTPPKDPPTEAFMSGVRRFRLQGPVEGDTSVLEIAGKHYHRTTNKLEVVGPYDDAESALRAFSVFVEPAKGSEA